MSATTNNNHWQRVTVICTSSDNEWQRVTKNDDEWQEMTASNKMNEYEW